MQRRLLRGISSLKYFLVLCLRCLKRNFCRLLMNLKDARVQMTILYLGYMSNVVLLVALGLGLYTEWMNTENTTILFISLMGLLVLAASCAMQYYFSQEAFGKALLHTWLGCILGVIIFTDPRDYQYETMQEVMDILLITSPICGLFWNICERFLHLKKHEPKLFSTKEILETSGFIAASLVTGLDAVAISLFTVAFIINLTAIRLKSVLSVLSLTTLIAVVSFVYLRDSQLKVNMFGLMCFAGRHMFEPIIDLYFSNFSTLERWQVFFNKSNFVRKIVVIIILILNLVSGALIGRLSANHKEWFVVVPLYVVFAVIWLCFHLISFISLWKLMNKVTDCNLTFNSLSDDCKSMNRIMASKGIRHFSLISRRLICLTLLSTLVLMGVGWETRTPYSLGLIMLIFPIEAGTLSLFWELGDFLGGTCTAFALIAPHTGERLGPGGGAKLLTAATVQDMSSRATTTLNKIQQFFNYSMLDVFGCDFSSSGISSEYLGPKIRQFFERRTSDGPRYDTYLLYYSGDSHQTGDWALAGEGSLKAETLLEWWAEIAGDTGSRLILVVDSLHAWRWAPEIARIQDHFVAIQTCKLAKPSDPEFGVKGTVGTFTDDWVGFNLSGDVEPQWTDKDRRVQAVYRVSKHWTDFTFHLPTREDILEHWDSNFPRFTKPLIKAVNFFGTRSLCCCCDSVRNCFKRKRMQWLPPKSTDTGHGFKLVRS